MNDICIEFIFEDYWDKLRGRSRTIDLYKEWIKTNIRESDYYFPRKLYNRVYFLNPEDLSYFTLINGRNYTIVKGMATIDTSKIDKMILRAEITERYNK
jgi:hypothetical protein